MDHNRNISITGHISDTNIPSSEGGGPQSHFEVKCSDEMRRSVPDAPRSTTLSV